MLAPPSSKRSTPRRTLALVTVAAWAWVLVLWSAPTWKVSAAGSFARAGADVIYAVGAQLCHQRPSRSFARDGIPLPVCGRCSGLYVGGALGLLLAAWRRPACTRPAAYWRSVLVLAAVPTGIAVVSEWTDAMLVTTPIRAACAVPLGVAAGWVLGAGVLGIASSPARWLAPADATEARERQ